MISMVAVQAEEREDFLAMAVPYFSELNPAFVPGADWKEHYFKNIVGNPRYFLRWILCDGARAGFILFGVENHRFLPRQHGVIYELYVLPKFRRRGVAGQCARPAIEELWKIPVSKIQLEVLEGAGAAAFWRSLGFHKVTERMVLDRHASSDADAGASFTGRDASLEDKGRSGGEQVELGGGGSRR